MIHIIFFFITGHVNIEWVSSSFRDDDLFVWLRTTGRARATVGDARASDIDRLLEEAEQAGITQLDATR